MLPLPEGARSGTLGHHCGLSALRSSRPQKRKNPCETRGSQGSKAERLRSESNRRWRICNRTANEGFPEENDGSGPVDHTVDHTQPADPALSAVVEAWSDLPPAVRAGILAMVQASRP
jgi:hypothetical protein